MDVVRRADWLVDVGPGAGAGGGEVLYSGPVAGLAEVRDLLLSLPDRTEADVRAGRFETYREYRTTPGVVLASVDDAVRFNLYHEGLHLGAILALRKLVA